MKPSGEPAVGSEIGAYRVERIVGRGGMGVVCLAADLQLRRKVALKVLAAHLAEDTRFRSRFLRESELAASLDHPNIIPVYAAGEAGGHLFLAMRYVEGPSLRHLVRIGPLPPAEAISIAAQIASALDAAHAKGLVHRDVKPSNVLIAPTAGAGGSDHAYLADFGLSRQLGEQERRGAHEPLMGTVEYAAPEQIRGGDVDGRADVYALGCLLHECLTGLPPFQRSSSAQTLFAHMEEQPPDASWRNPRLDSAVDTVLAKALAKAPDERYQNCRDFVDDARLALGIAPEDRSRLRSHPLLATMALVLAAAVAVAVWAIARSQEDARAKDAARRILALRSAAPRHSGSSVTRIDPATNEVVAAVAAPPDQTALAVGRKAIWVATGHDYGLMRIDPRSNSTLFAPHVPGRASGLAIAGATVAVVTEPPAAVTILSRRCVFSIASKPCITTIPFSTRKVSPIRWVAPRPASNGRAIWVTDPARRRIDRIDPYLPKITDIVPIQTLIGGRRINLTGLAASLDAVWVTGDAWRTIVHHNVSGTWFETRPLAAYLWRVDPSTHRVGARIRLPRPADSIAVGAGAVWVTGGGRASIWRIDPSRNRVTGRIDTGDSASGIAVGHGSLWVGDPEQGVVRRINPKTLRVLDVITVGPDPQQIAIGFGGVWVTHWDVH
jgi:protein kinase-like protein